MIKMQKRKEKEERLAAAAGVQEEGEHVEDISNESPSDVATESTVDIPIEELSLGNTIRLSLEDTMQKEQWDAATDLAKQLSNKQSDAKRTRSSRGKKTTTVAKSDIVVSSHDKRPQKQLRRRRRRGSRNNVAEVRVSEDSGGVVSSLSIIYNQ